MHSGEPAKEGKGVSGLDLGLSAGLIAACLERLALSEDAAVDNTVADGGCELLDCLRNLLAQPGEKS